MTVISNLVIKMNQEISSQRIAFFIPNLHGGGAERVAINLLKGMSAKNVPLDLVLTAAEGPYLTQVPEQVRIVNLTTRRVVKAILPLSRYLQQEKPFALVSHMNHANVMAVIAKKLSGIKTRLLLIEHDTLSVAKSKLLRGALVPPLVKLLYPRADFVVGVSKGTVQDLENHFGIPREKLKVIYNPVVDDILLTKAKAAFNHPWFQEGSPPVFLAVGRLTEQKDFFTLIKAFELVRRQRSARLIILGEGESRSELEAMIAELGISEDISMPGFVENPYAYMSRATAFVLSSRWEGLGVVLIEAMACGCPVIATDCPSGPKEILAAGQFGALIPIGDVSTMSAAMLQVLKAPVDRNVLMQRAMYFSVERAVSEYLSLLEYKQ